MAARCYSCFKKADVGNNVSHAKNRTKRLRKPNLHRAHLVIGGVKKAVVMCTKCLRSFKKLSHASQTAAAV